MPGSTAARVAGWRRRYAGLPAPLAPTQDTANAGALRVELFLNEAWVDITRRSVDEPGVYYEDRVNISRGRPNEATQAETSTLTFTINNKDGWFTPRNPLSPYYGALTRNTPIRVSVVQPGNGERRYRFHGEVASWPQKWDVTGTDVRVMVTANGILRRLTQGSSPLLSTLRRGLLSKKVRDLRAYWPCEDPAGSESIASAIGGKPMRLVGAPGFAASSDFDCSDALPTLNTSEWTGVVPSYPASSAIQVRFLMHIPTTATNDQSILKLFTSGSAQMWHLVYATGGDLTLEAYSGNDLDTVIGTSGLVAFAVNGKLLRVSIELEQNGSDVDWLVAVLEVGKSTGFTADGTLSNRTIKQAKQVIINNGSGLGTDVVIGHVSVQSTITSIFDFAQELRAYAGERAWSRIRRLCNENDIEFAQPDDSRTGISVSSERMGPQRPKALVDLLREAADADGGILYETRDAFGLGYRTLTTIYNQPARVELDYAANHLLPSLDPTDDDQLTRNDVTVSRENGSSARVVLEDGPLSILPPPAGVGVYDSAETAAVQYDEQCATLAGWRMHLGTVDEARYPVVNVHLKRSQIASDVGLETALHVADLGDKLTIDNPPPWLPPETISQLIQGYSEQITGLEHTVAFNCSPASPFDVAMWDSVQSRYGNSAGDRYDTAGSELAAPATADATTLSVATTAGLAWTNDPVELPYDLMVGGERVRVEAASSRITDTFTRSASSGWGSADSGQAWSTSGGAASDYSVNGSTGLVSHSAVSTRHFTSIGSGLADVAMLARVSVPVLATGASISAGLVCRYTDDNNFYLVQLLHDTAGTIDLEIVKRVAGTFTTIVSRSNHLAYTPGTLTWARFAAHGTLLRAHIWAGDLDDEPAGWTVQGTDASLSTGAVGTHSNLLGSNTNTLPLSISHDDLSVEVGAVSGTTSPQTMTVTRSVNGISKSHTVGTDVRLFQPAYRAL